ncbi:MAG: N(4)-(beta-N-acetylglucosaminyl)-L-asparaginase [Brevinema sp.]
MSRWAFISTWRMAFDACVEAEHLLSTQQSTAADVVESSIRQIEDYPFYKSVGCGGLPNINGVVELDAAFSDGDTWDFGGVAGVKNLANPVSLARSISKDRFNCFLVADGAEQEAQKQHFVFKNMLTERAQQAWEQRKLDITQKNLSPYNGHDTVGAVVLDQQGSMAAAVSTSGLFMKKPGRVGDSPFIGSGLYVDSEVGGCVATGLGEDIMKGCLSYEVVRLMEEGYSPSEAGNRALSRFEQKMLKKRGVCGAVSLAILNDKGEWGVATNVEFSFVVSSYNTKPIVYLANPKEGRTIIEKASEKWLHAWHERTHNNKISV